MKNPFFTAVLKRNIAHLKRGQTIFFKVINREVMLVTNGFKKETDISGFLDIALPIVGSNGNLFYNPNADRKAEKLSCRG